MHRLIFGGAFEMDLEMKDTGSQQEAIDWTEISNRGLLIRINREIMHPLGLAVFRDTETGLSGGAFVSPTGKFEYSEEVDAESEVADIPVTFTRWFPCSIKPVNPGVYQLRHRRRESCTLWMSFWQGYWRGGIFAKCDTGEYNKSPSNLRAHKGKAFPENVMAEWEWRGQDGNLHPKK